MGLRSAHQARTRKAVVQELPLRIKLAEKWRQNKR
jgi:hypothetical protein